VKSIHYFEEAEKIDPETDKLLSWYCPFKTKQQREIFILLREIKRKE
jgi:hypothetical protein